MEKKIKAVEIIEAVKDNVVNAVDLDADGKIDRADASILADKVEQKVQNVDRQLELKMLRPIFISDVSVDDFHMPKLIRLTKMDWKRANSEVCKDSIGYKSTEKDLEIVNVFRNNIDDFGITLYPDSNQIMYYVDPSNSKRYISLDKYFGYLKQVRVHELHKIAQELGATYFKVTVKEDKKAGVKHKKGIDVRGGKKGKKPKEAGVLKGKAGLEEIAAVNVAIETESKFPGHEPRKPELQYFVDDPTIKGLVELRMNNSSPLTQQKYKLDCSTTVGMKVEEALKVDAALKAMKFEGDVTVADEVNVEEVSFFEYEIAFDSDN